MRSRVSILIHLLIMLGLTLPTGLEAAPRSGPTERVPQTAPAGASDTADGPVLAKKKQKRAKTKQDRRQDRRKDAARERQRDRKQAEPKGNRQKSKGNPKQGQGNRKQGKPASDAKTQEGQRDARTVRAQNGGPTEIVSGRLPGAMDVAFAPNAPLSADDRYIVMLGNDAGNPLDVANEIARSAVNVTPTHVYKNVFEGFAAVIPPSQLEAIKQDPRVKAVVPDSVVKIAAQPVPPGIARINADDHPVAKIDGIDERVDIDVAVVDTAGNDEHPDLNIHAWANCTDSPVNTDDHGHGTHVGGTIGALDNNIGVVGVAPGARLWNFRVLKAVPGGATGLNSWIICGLDLVTFYATPRPDGLGDIEVANASLGGDGSDSDCGTGVDPYHEAYCRAVAAGVTVVVAAMNSAKPADGVVPATYREVITVSALADSDGRPGGLGPATSAGADDTLATFSNYGGEINIAAPGVDIRSTVPTGNCAMCNATGYGLSNGTSMASPHVAGAAALYLANHPGASPQQVKDMLDATKEVFRFPNDKDPFAEGVLRVVADPVANPDPGDGGQNGGHHKKKHKKKHGKKHGKKGKKRR